MCEPIRFRSRPEQVEVVTFDRSNAAELAAWVRANGGIARIDEAGDLVLGTGTKEQFLLRGAVVVRYASGRFSAMSANDFAARFEPLAS